MSTSERYERQYRYHEIPGPIRDLQHKNIVINRLIGEFVSGHIVTKEELLCQLVIHLARDWNEEYNRLVDMMQKGIGPTSLTPKSP